MTIVEQCLRVYEYLDGNHLFCAVPKIVATPITSKLLIQIVPNVSKASAVGNGRGYAHGRRAPSQALNEFHCQLLLLCTPWNLMNSQIIVWVFGKTPQNMNSWVRDDLKFSNWGGSSSCSCFPWILYHWKQENLQEDVAPPTIEPILQSFCPMLSKPHSSKSVLGILDAQLGKSLESRQHRHKIQVIQARLNYLGCIILCGWSVSSPISKSTIVENWVLLGIPLLLKLWTTILWNLLTSPSRGDRDLPSNAMQLPAIWQQSAESVSSIVQLPHRALELEGVAACERNRFPSASPCADLGSAQEIIIDHPNHPYTSTGWILTSCL